MNKVQLPKAHAFYGFQIIVIENIHSETCSKLIDTLIKDPLEKTCLLNGTKTMPSIKQKADWALQWCNPKNASFSEHCFVFCAIEGIFFS
jgi:ribonucleotide reductase beta subunit family protein with ferritin-like domain